MFKLIKQINKKEIFMIIPIFIFIVLQVYLDLKLPDYMSEMTVYLQSGSATLKDILTPGYKMLGCALLSFFAAIVTGYYAAMFAASYTQRLRDKLFNKTENFGMEEINKFSLSSLIIRTTSDTVNVQRFFAMGLQIIIKAPLLSISAVAKIYSKNYEWSLITGASVLILLVVVSSLIIIVLPKTKIIQTLTDKLNTRARENITGVRVIRAFNANSYQIDRFEEANKEMTDTNLFINKSMAVLMPTLQFIMPTLTLCIYLTGAYLIDSSLMDMKIALFGDMVVFSQYAAQIIMSFIMLVMIIILFPRTQVSANRINEVLESESSIKNGAKKLKSIENVEFKDVSFKYPDADEYFVKNISFEINKGEIVAIIGKTGGGKSSIINLIPRLYDATEGEVLINGKNVKDYDLKSLYSKIGYVSQKPVLFKGTVESNVVYEEKFNKEQLDRALKISMAHEFVYKLDNNIKAEVASKGTNLSGGQKQRLSIARSIYKDADLYIFDDTFSALDYKTDSSVRKNITKHFKDRSQLIVAQRIGTIMHADKIIVVEDGKIVGMGTHSELLKQCKIYKEIAESQLTEGDLKNGSKGK